MWGLLRSSKTKIALAWLLILSLVLLAFLSLFIPLATGQPSKEQTPGDLAVAYFLQRNSPHIVIALFAISAGLSLVVWRRTKKLIAKLPLFFPLALMIVFVWAAYQHPMEWFFPQLRATDYARAGEADFVSGDDMVMAVEVNGEPVAYPVRQMLYHHIVHDRVGGTSVVSTY